MKTLIATLALLVAAPVAAQSAPAAADPHAAHHKGAEHKGHESHKDCCKDGKMACCDKMKAKDAADCCKEEKAANSSEKQDAHEGHAH